MSFISQPLTFISIPPTRSFAGISGYVTINENTNDSLEITQQPVQQGASISDHAFKKPVSLSIQILFGNNILKSIAGLSVTVPAFTQSLSDIYNTLLALQQPQAPAPVAVPGPVQPGGAAPQFVGLPSIQPFTVVTPKRTYYNMLLATLGCTTDKKTESVLAINCTFQEVIIVPITTTNVPPSQLKNPGSNSGTQNVGSKSVLYVASGGP
jgi:hypothetical protein